MYYMEAFISYSHADTAMLDVFHKHLAQMKRDGLIADWTDREINAGARFEQKIQQALMNMQIFIALLSPDYIASKYCYEKELTKALEWEAQGRITIIPVILHPCDWLNTPFKDFKALPRDGKPVSEWENVNTAWLDVILSIRKLLTVGIRESALENPGQPAEIIPSKNYRIKKDFDSIQKLEFVDKTFSEITEFLKRYIREISQLDNIKSRVLVDNDQDFGCVIVNRHKVNAEAHLGLSISSDSITFSGVYSQEKQLTFVLNAGNRPATRSFTLSTDEFHLFWTEGGPMGVFTGRHNVELTSKEIAEIIWSECLQSIGIF